MLSAERNILWQCTALCFGLALPFVLLGRGVMFALLLVGLIAGVLATRGQSLRHSVALLKGSPVVWLVLCFLATCALTAFLGIYPAESFDKTYQLVGMTVASALLFMVLRELPGRYLGVMQNALVLGTLFVATIALIDMLLHDVRLSTALHGAEKALTPLRYNFFSAVLAVLLPFIWAFHVRRRAERKTLAIMAAPVVLPALGMMVVGSGGRAGIVAACVGGLIFYILAVRWHKLMLHARHWWLALVGVALGLPLFYYAQGAKAFWGRFNHLIEPGQTSRGPAGGRLDIWEHVVRVIPEHFWLGVGPNAYRYLPGEQVDLHPHNFALQIMLETGILGTILFFGLLAYIFRTFWGYAQGNIYGVAALASLSAFCVASLFNTSIFNIWWVTFFMAITLFGWRMGWSHGQPKRAQVVRSALRTPGGQVEG